MVTWFIPPGTLKQGIQDVIPLVIPDTKVPTTKGAPKNKKVVALCKFFKNGRYNKKDEDCCYDHPKICRKFNQFGPKDGINKGWDEKWGFFHPNAFRNSNTLQKRT